jgi:hypothetical protein
LFLAFSFLPRNIPEAETQPYIEETERKPSPCQNHQQLGQGIREKYDEVFARMDRVVLLMC